MFNWLAQLKESNQRCEPNKNASRIMMAHRGS